ncbi:hypothetical protein PYW07_011619 [Mythimna separata]|uniref:Uncharacterized protein n=1 Tax=Mythimna separata TaxID=271217 RepID=A0AAD7Y6F8_MYTSE|nr:hypothetical protein PYW07_011619 [Mythimna separata]
MAPKFFLVFLLLFCSQVQSASLLEKGYDYFVNLGKNLGPNLMSMLECVGQNEAWECAREKAGKMLDLWEDEVEKERRSWEEEADAEIRTSGRSLEEMPSKIGREITDSLSSLTNVLERGMARSLAKKHGGGGGIDSITISGGSGDKKKMKKKTKPPKIHLIHPVMMPLRKAPKQEKGRAFGSGVQSWVIGERSLPVQENVTEELAEVPRGIVSDMWAMGQNALDTLAEHVVENEDLENGVKDRSSVEEQRGKKKKKKKAILKLLILGAVIKAKIGTLLQILTYKLQIKFFIVAVLGLAINLARLWIDLKNKHSQQPQKIIYYEHAQHQHHYDHEEEEQHGWGPWSRSILPEDVSMEENQKGWGSWWRSLLPNDETDVDASEVSPYKAQERNPLVYTRPYLTRV